MKKTQMGLFIAALRKSKGFTQKDLAEKLNISNKTISKWECGDGYPEITVLPVLAEIFDVTVDELLKGERINKDNDKSTSKTTKKQFNFLLNQSILKFKNYSYISLSLVIIGIILLFSISYAFYRPIIGFGTMMVFVISAILIQIIISNNLLIYYDEANIIQEKNIHYLKLYYKKNISIFYSSLFAILLSLPLIFTKTNFVKSVISFERYLVILPLLLLSFFIISSIGKYFILKIISKKYFPILSDSDKKGLRKINLKFALILSLVVIITVASNIFTLSSIENASYTNHFNSSEEYNKYINKVEKYFNEKDFAMENDSIIIHENESLNDKEDTAIRIEDNSSEQKTEYFYLNPEYENIINTDNESFTVTYKYNWNIISQKRLTATQIFIGIYIIESILLFGWFFIKKRKIMN